MALCRPSAVLLRGGRFVHASFVSESPEYAFPPNKKECMQLRRDIKKFANTEPTPTTLHQLIAFSQNVDTEKLIKSSLWLLDELPIRLAKRIVELERLPYGLGLMKSTQRVRSFYVDSFRKLRTCPRPRTKEQVTAFTKLCREILKIHDPTLPLMAQGMSELKGHIGRHFIGVGPEDVNVAGDEFTGLHQDLDNFFLARVGIRLLMHQHVMLHDEPSSENRRGIIQLNTRPAEVCKDAARDAEFMCQEAYGVAPQVTIVGGEDVSFPYVPSHLYYIFFELLKNAMRATVEWNHFAGRDMPDVEVIIADGGKVTKHDTLEDIAIKISDQGGGIKRSNMGRLWSYNYTTSSEPVSLETAAFSKAGPMCGYGYGVPISRVYARYFGGDLSLNSMEGYGTDAYCYIPRLGDRTEPLP